MRATIGGLRALSWNAACAFGEKLGALGYRPLGIRKRVVERQIAAAFPELRPEAVVRSSRANRIGISVERPSRPRSSTRSARTGCRGSSRPSKAGKRSRR